MIRKKQRDGWIIYIYIYIYIYIWMVGGWVYRDKKWRVGWIDRYKKDVWQDGQKKNR